MLEVKKSRRRIGENADRTLGIPVMPELGPSDHLRDALLVPVCGPEVAVIHGEGEAAGPASQAGKLPTCDQSIGNAGGVASEALAFSERQLANPVASDLVSRVKLAEY